MAKRAHHVKEIAKFLFGVSISSKPLFMRYQPWQLGIKSEFVRSYPSPFLVTQIRVVSNAISLERDAASFNTYFSIVLNPMGFLESQAAAFSCFRKSCFFWSLVKPQAVQHFFLFQVMHLQVQIRGAFCPTLIKVELEIMPYFTRLIKMDQVRGFEPLTSAILASQKVCVSLRLYCFPLSKEQSCGKRTLQFKSSLICFCLHAHSLSSSKGLTIKPRSSKHRS